MRPIARRSRLFNSLLGTAGALACGLALASDWAPADSESWQPADPDLLAVEVRGARVWAVGYWGTVLLSSDGGGTWARPRTGTRETLTDVSFADADHGWAVGEYGTVLRSTDGGQRWQAQVIPDGDGAAGPLATHLFGVAAVSPSEAWAVGDYGVVAHVRDGESWQRVRLPENVFADDEVPDRIFNGVDFGDPLHGWIVGEFGSVLVTADGGATWSASPGFAAAAAGLYLFDVSAAGPQTAAVVGLGGRVLVTTDGGASWTSQATGTSAALYGVYWGNPSGVAVGDRGELVGTGDGGMRWGRGRGPRLFNWLRGVDGAGTAADYAVGEKGVVLRSDDAGTTWRQLLGSAPPPIAGVTVLEAGRAADAATIGPKDAPHAGRAAP